jgi:hypothetical protein
LTGDGVGVGMSATYIANVADPYVADRSKESRSSEGDMRITRLSSPARYRAVATSTWTYLLRVANGV